MPSSAADVPDLSGLIELSRDPQLDLKPVVLRVQTDLFLAAPIRDRAVLEAFGALATGLVPTVDEETAIIVARKLGPCADTPESVLIRLAERGGDVAEALIETGATLPPAVLEAVRKAGIDIAMPSADKEDSAKASAPEPEEAGEPEFSMDDDSVRKPSVADQIRAARTDADRAWSLLARADVSNSDLAPLWLHAENHQRAAIRDAVEATAALRPCPPAPRDLPTVLTGLAAERDIAGFVAALSKGVGLPSTFLAAAPDAITRYDLLTLALRAADMRDSEAIYVFLTLNDTVAKSVNRVFQLASLFRSTSRAAARDLLSAILDVKLPERATTGEHQSYLGPDAARPRTSVAAERSLPRAIPTKRLQRSS